MSYVRKTCLVLSVLLSLAGDTLSADHSRDPCTSCCPPPTCCSCDGAFFVRGDLLWWTPRITGLDLNFGTGAIVENVNGCTQILTTEETDQDPHFNWDAGYRVGVGYETDEWTAEV